MGEAYLGEFEHLVLLAILRLGREAHGVEIRRTIEERAERSVSFGAMYSTLRRLKAKDYVASEELTGKGGGSGRTKQLFTITPDGQMAMQAAQRRFQRMSAGIVQGV